MMLRSHCLTACLTILLLAPSAARAEGSVKADACHGDMASALGARLREYRGVILGTPKSADAPEGTVRFDKDGDPWTKTGGGTWRSAAHEGLTWSDTQMDDQADAPPRIGWLEQKKAATSELIPPLLQSMRALQCKLENVCGVLGASLAKPDDDKVKVTTPGCEPETIPVLRACIPEEQGDAAQSAVEQLTTECIAMKDAIVKRETHLLKFLIAYDSAHRTLRQFLGLLETFTLDLRTTLLGPVWEAVRAFHGLGRIPCFSSQCDQ